MTFLQNKMQKRKHEFILGIFYFIQLSSPLCFYVRMQSADAKWQLFKRIYRKTHFEQTFVGRSRDEQPFLFSQTSNCSPSPFGSSSNQPPCLQRHLIPRPMVSCHRGPSLLPVTSQRHRDHIHTGLFKRHACLFFCTLYMIK